MGSRNVNFRMDDLESSLLSAVCDLERRTITEALHGMIADGLKYRMLFKSPVKLDAGQIHPITVEATPRNYLKFMEAITYRTGTNPKSKYRFVQYPDSEYWRQQELAGKWTITYHTMRITDTGIKGLAGEADELDDQIEKLRSEAQNRQSNANAQKILKL